MSSFESLVDELERITEEYRQTSELEIERRVALYDQARSLGRRAQDALRAQVNRARGIHESSSKE